MPYQLQTEALLEDALLLTELDEAGTELEEELLTELDELITELDELLTELLTALLELAELALPPTTPNGAG